MKVKVSRGEKIFQVFNYLILTLITIVCLYPFWHVVMGSLSSTTGLMSHSGLLLWPKGFSLGAYATVLKNPMIASGYKNTFIFMCGSLILQMIMTCLGAYFFSRRDAMLRRPLMLMVLFTMYFSGGMIPFYLNLVDLGLTGNRWGIILPFMISTYNMIILRTSFEAIPESLTEAAQIDGAGHLTVLFKIILPLTKATLAVIVLYYAVGNWNGWFWPSVLLRDRELMPLQVVLREILIANDMSSMEAGSGTVDAEGIAMAMKYATIIVGTVPILMIYPMLQKHFAKGVMVGAVKG